MKKYLVRPHDFAIFEVDPSNGCYRSYERIPKEHRHTAFSHFTFENLIKNYDFFEIEEVELEHYLEKHDFHYGFLGWQCRPDGHGGSKGGTMKEYLEYLDRVKRYQDKIRDDGIVRK